MGPPNQPPNGFKIGANFKQICQNVKNRDFSVFGAFLDLDNRTGARFGCLFFLIVHPCLVALGWFFSWSANLVSADAEAADDGIVPMRAGWDPPPPLGRKLSAESESDLGFAYLGQKGPKWAPQGDQGKSLSAPCLLLC